MGRKLNIVTPLHKITKRDYLARMVDDKILCMKLARQYDKDYWDGDRRYGYGGYKYDGRWEAVARKLIDIYRLGNSSAILDVGCGKGYLLYEFKKLLPGSRVMGCDISEYAIKNSKEEIRQYLFKHGAQERHPFEDKEFDLVISLTTLYNLPIDELKAALREIERVGKDRYITLESYRSEAELFNLQCWALTCRTFLSADEWMWLFDQFGYTGDYEFIYFE
ncbi:MAG: class I SAM-dependent methyltransferase [Candidatus Omnitrophota bacterium]|nr:class I SAM-dependent methyltransferase [Candidatus Omnitrophota bacterium]